MCHLDPYTNLTDREIEIARAALNLLVSMAAESQEKYRKSLQDEQVNEDARRDNEMVIMGGRSLIHVMRKSTIDKVIEGLESTRSTKRIEDIMTNYKDVAWLLCLPCLARCRTKLKLISTKHNITRCFSCQGIRDCYELHGSNREILTVLKSRPSIEELTEMVGNYCPVCGFYLEPADRPCSSCEATKANNSVPPHDPEASLSHELASPTSSHSPS